MPSANCGAGLGPALQPAQQQTLPHQGNVPLCAAACCGIGVVLLLTGGRKQAALSEVHSCAVPCAAPLLSRASHCGCLVCSGFTHWFVSPTSSSTLWKSSALSPQETGPMWHHCLLCRCMGSWNTSLTSSKHS